MQNATLENAGRRFFTFFLFLLFVIQYAAIPQTKDPSAGDYAKINGAKLWYEIKGSGDPIVLIPGGPGNSHLYLTPWFDELAKNHKVIYFDAFGRGKSDRAKDSTEYTFQRDIEDLEGLRKALGFDKWTVLGHSYGGMVAQAYALEYPASVDKLVLSIHFTAEKCGRRMMITQIMKLKTSTRRYGLS